MGKTQKEKIPKGGMGKERLSQRAKRKLGGGAENIHYNSQSEMAHRWEPMNRINERQYNEFRNSWGEWMRLDGAWRETRGPTQDEVEKTDGGIQTIGFGDHSDKTFVEVLTKDPRYAEYLIDEGRQDHLSMKNIPIVANHREDQAGAKSR